jgi:acyl carrier protein
MIKVRKAVVDALQSTTGILNNPNFSAAVLKGENVELDALGIDSLSMMQTLMLVEESLDTELNTELFADSSSLNDLVKAVHDFVR